MSFRSRANRVALVALVGAAVLAAPTAASQRTGLYGVVRKGPTQPVCSPDLPCTAPLASGKLLFTRAGRTTSTTTDVAGGYRIMLAAGTYSVRVGDGKRRVSPATIAVVSGRVRHVDFLVDTHIR
jgi:hypothetical protein